MEQIRWPPNYAIEYILTFNKVLCVNKFYTSHHQNKEQTYYSDFDILVQQIINNYEYNKLCITLLLFIK